MDVHFDMNYPPNKVVNLNDKIRISEALKDNVFYPISRTKLLNALHFYGDKSPKPVMRFCNADWYDKDELLKWGRDNKVRYTAYPDKPYKRKKKKNIVEPPSNFNKLAVQFLTRRF
jgi:hypothetical protein